MNLKKTLNVKIKKFILLALLMPIFCYGETKGTIETSKRNLVEELARKITQKYNANAERMKNNWILSTSASAVGSSVTYKYVVNVKRTYPLVSNAKEFSNELRNDVIFNTCRTDSEKNIFKKGVNFTYIYYNIWKEKVAEFNVRAKDLRCDLDLID